MSNKSDQRADAEYKAALDQARADYAAAKDKLAAHQAELVNVNTELVKYRRLVLSLAALIDEPVPELAPEPEPIRIRKPYKLLAKRTRPQGRA